MTNTITAPVQLLRMYDDGSGALSPEGMSVLLGVPVDDILDLCQDPDTAAAMPLPWMLKGARRRKAAQAHTGGSDELVDVLAYGAHIDHGATAETDAHGNIFMVPKE